MAVPSISLPAHAAQTWNVLNCSDFGAGSLRDIIQNKAQSDDFVNLATVPGSCGMSSTITLSSGEIVVPQANLTLVGPQDASVTIRGTSTSRVFRHTGDGILKIDSLVVRDGHFSANGAAKGGCISSLGEVYLANSTVTGCTVSSATDLSYGGGIYAHRVHLLESRVDQNEALVEANQPARGGGISCLYLLSKYSEISSNIAHDAAITKGAGGGAFVIGGVNIFSSTIDNNVAGFGGGLSIQVSGGGDSLIQNSTISGNFASEDYAAARINADYFEIANSTIAFNYSTSSFSGPLGAVSFTGAAQNSRLRLSSTIVANNTATAAGIPSDVYLQYVFDPSVQLIGADNLVVASNATAVASGVITETGDPRLLPLSMSSGFTKTHRLLADSPAIGFGNNSAMLTLDQRGYSRTTGSAASVDIGAVQSDPLFRSGFD
jgi:hypothetical protein